MGEMYGSKTLTISVAAYNMEEYLPRCLDSLIHPEIMHDIEVLIINDGSKDNTHRIAQEYEKKYPAVFKAINKPNGGHGSTINKGIELASGKYFKILDADDWFDTEELVKLICFLRKSDCDIILNSVICEYYFENKSIAQPFKNIEFGKVYTLDQPLNIGRPWFELATTNYKTQILQQNAIKISECYYCDIEYSAYPLKYVYTVMFSDCNVYRYFIGRQGQSISSESIARNYDDHFRITRNVLDWYLSNKESEKISAKMDIYYKMMIQKISVNYVILMLHKSDRGEAKSLLRDFDSYLKGKGEEIYSIAGNCISFYGIKPIILWRKFGINIYRTILYKTYRNLRQSTNV